MKATTNVQQSLICTTQDGGQPQIPQYPQLPEELALWGEGRGDQGRPVIPEWLPSQQQLPPQQQRQQAPQPAPQQQPQQQQASWMSHQMSQQPSGEMQQPSPHAPLSPQHPQPQQQQQPPQQQQWTPASPPLQQPSGQQWSPAPSQPQQQAQQQQQPLPQQSSSHQWQLPQQEQQAPQELQWPEQVRSVAATDAADDVENAVLPLLCRCMCQELLLPLWQLQHTPKCLQPTLAHTVGLLTAADAADAAARFARGRCAGRTMGGTCCGGAVRRRRRVAAADPGGGGGSGGASACRGGGSRPGRPAVVVRMGQGRCRQQRHHMCAPPQPAMHL